MSSPSYRPNHIEDLKQHRLGDGVIQLADIQTRTSARLVGAARRSRLALSGSGRRSRIAIAVGGTVHLGGGGRRGRGFGHLDELRGEEVSRLGSMECR